MHISHIVLFLVGTIVGLQRNWFIMHIVYCIGLIYDISIGSICHSTSACLVNFSMYWQCFWVFQPSHKLAMPKEGCTQKVCGKLAPYIHKTKLSVTKTQKDTPKTFAKSSAAQHHEDLILADWLTVFKFIDEHPGISQAQVVNHSTCKDGALIFMQPTLSQKLEQCTELELHGDSNPSALSSKWPCIVTCPNVECALYLWVLYMEEEKEMVNRPMLCEKQKWFEELFKVPRDQWLQGEGWVTPFCKAYKLKKYWHHGEAASVDDQAADRECKHVQELMKRFAPRDRWNFDEMSLFPKWVISVFWFNLTYPSLRAPPDHGLATKYMSGKKNEWFCITLGFACNANGSEKLLAFYIRKSAKPKCFNKKTPNEFGFYYWNNKNKKAWMTSELFEEYASRVEINKLIEYWLITNLQMAQETWPQNVTWRPTYSPDDWQLLQA